MRFTNKFMGSARQPNLLISRRCYDRFRWVLIACSNLLSRSLDMRHIPINAIEDFLVNCHESNRLLEKLSGRDLVGFGYPM